MRLFPVVPKILFRDSDVDDFCRIMFLKMGERLKCLSLLNGYGKS